MLKLHAKYSECFFCFEWFDARHTDLAVLLFIWLLKWATFKFVSCSWTARLTLTLSWNHMTGKTAAPCLIVKKHAECLLCRNVGSVLNVFIPDTRRDGWTPLHLTCLFKCASSCWSPKLTSLRGTGACRRSSLKWCAIASDSLALLQEGLHSSQNCHG